VGVQTAMTDWVVHLCEQPNLGQICYDMASHLCEELQP